MTDHDATHDAAPHDHQHGHGGIAKYIYVFIALCILTTMSFWTSNDLPIPCPFHDNPAVSRAFMMAVSCAKSMLVIMFFMHAKYEANWKYVLTIPAAIMSLFLMMMLVPDVGMRMRNPTGGPPGVAQEQVMHLEGTPAMSAALRAADENNAEH